MPIDQLMADLGLRQNLTLVILTVALMMARILPVIIYSPFLGGEVVPNEVKIGLGVVLAAVLFPAVSARMTHISLSAIPYISLLLKELFVGMSMAFVVDMVFQTATVAGHLVDSVSGLSNAQILVPQIGHQVTLFSSLKLQLAIVFFLTLNGHHLVIQALGDSFLAIPIDQFPAFSHGLWPFFDLMIRVFAELMKVGLAIAGPAFVASFLTDLALGMINRVAPQVQVFFISMQIKPLVVTAMVLLSIHLILGRIEVEFRHMFNLLGQTIRLLS